MTKTLIGVLALAAMGCGLGEAQDPEAPTSALSASSETARTTGVVAWEAYQARLVGKAADGQLLLDLRFLPGPRLAVQTPEAITVGLKDGRFDGLSGRTLGLVRAFLEDDSTQGLPDGVVAAFGEPTRRPPRGGCPEGCAVALARACNGISLPRGCTEFTTCCALEYARCCS